jgi:hypothetical protein
LKSGGAKLEGLRFEKLCQPVAEYDTFLRIMKHIIGGDLCYIFLLRAYLLRLFCCVLGYGLNGAEAKSGDLQIEAIIKVHT